MTQYKPNTENLKYVVENLYHALTGEKPDDKKKESLYAGVEGMVKLYKENPNAFYAAAAVSLLEGGARAKFQSHLADVIVKYLAQAMIEESGYTKDNPKNRSDFGGN